MINSSVITKTLHKELKPYGFVKKGSTWYLSEDDVVAVLNLQKSNYDNTFFLNIGFWLRQEEDVQYPKHEQCHVRARADDVLSAGSRSISEILCEDATIYEEDERINLIGTIIRENIIPLLRKGLSRHGLSELIEQDGFLIRRDARRLLEL